MRFSELLEIVGDEPLFESALLLAGRVDAHSTRHQLSRWTARGDIVQLRRGLYALAPPYRKTDVHPFVLANALVEPSYVSLQTALRHYDMIPEHVPTITSVTTRRPSQHSTSLGAHIYRHIDTSTFWGYERVEVRAGQHAWIATPEKALLDLVHLVPGGDSSAHLVSLRLQNLAQVDLDRLDELAARWQKPKFRRAATTIRRLVDDDIDGFVSL